MHRVLREMMLAPGRRAIAYALLALAQGGVLGEGWDCQQGEAGKGWVCVAGEKKPVKPATEEAGAKALKPAPRSEPASPSPEEPPRQSGGTGGTGAEEPPQQPGETLGTRPPEERGQPGEKPQAATAKPTDTPPASMPMPVRRQDADATATPIGAEKPKARQPAPSGETTPPNTVQNQA
jgi:hypothetical protein